MNTLSVILVSLIVYSLFGSSESHAVQSYDWTIPTEPYQSGRDLWANCTGTLNGKETEMGYKFYKDGENFYELSDQSSGKALKFGVKGLSADQIQVFDKPGRVLIKAVRQSNAGKYLCKYYAYAEDHHVIEAKSNEIELRIIGDNTPPPTTTTTTTKIPTTTQSDERAVITGFSAPESVDLNDDFVLNCSYALQTGQKFDSLRLSKDNIVFYTYVDNKTTIDTKANIKVSVFQISAIKTSPGAVKFTSANQDFEGEYKCDLWVRSSKGIVMTANEKRVIKFNNKQQIWSPIITEFVVPNALHPKDDYWVNCSYILAANEWLYSLNISKDGEVFYSYFKNKTYLQDVGELSQYKMNTIRGEIGRVRITEAMDWSRGWYRCELTTTRGSDQRTLTKEQFVEYSTSSINASKYITYVSIPAKLGRGDDFWINSTVAEGSTMLWLAISLNDNLFYNSSANPQLRSIDGIDSKQVEAYNDGIKIKHAVSKMRGKYTIAVMVRTRDNTTATETVDYFVDFGDDWQPVISRFYAPESLRKRDSYFTNCSYILSTNESLNSLTIDKDDEVFYNLTYNIVSNTLVTDEVKGIRGIEGYQLVRVGAGNVKINDPTVEAKGLYKCTLTTTRESKTVSNSKTLFVDYNRAVGLIGANFAHLFIILFASFALKLISIC